MACELLANALKEIPVGQEYEKLLKVVFAARRRNYSKFLMSAGRVSDARTQLKRSLKDMSSFLSGGQIHAFVDLNLSAPNPSTTLARDYS